MKPFEQSIVWYASDSNNIPHPSDFVMSGVTTGVAANKVVATGLFPNTITFEPGDIICSDLDWLVAKVIRRETDDELLLDTDIFSAPGNTFRIYRQNKGKPGTVYNTGGSAKDFTIQPVGFVDSNAPAMLFTVQSNETLPMAVIKVLDTGTTLKKFTLLF
jgi:hypothetical protein